MAGTTPMPSLRRYASDPVLITMASRRSSPMCRATKQGASRLGLRPRRRASPRRRRCGDLIARRRSRPRVRRPRPEMGHRVASECLRVYPKVQCGQRFEERAEHRAVAYRAFAFVQVDERLDVHAQQAYRERRISEMMHGRSHGTREGVPRGQPGRYRVEQPKPLEDIRYTTVVVFAGLSASPAVAAVRGSCRRSTLSPLRGGVGPHPTVQSSRITHRPSGIGEVPVDDARGSRPAGPGERARRGRDPGKPDSQISTV